jgi:hypothetical protein
VTTVTELPPFPSQAVTLYVDLVPAGTTVRLGLGLS